MNLKIGLDLDGVIIDHTINKIKLAKQFGYFLKPADTSSGAMEKIVSAKTKLFIQNGIYGKIGLSSRPMKNAKKVLGEITKLFPAPHVISRRLQKKFAIQWLKNNKFFPLFLNRIIFVKSDFQKNNYCKEIGINVYLDDKIKVLSSLASVKYRILFDPYGYYYKNPPRGIQTVKTWDEFLKYLQKIRSGDNIK